MNPDLVIEAQGLGKSFALYERPSDRLKSLLWGRDAAARTFWALQGVDLQVARGEVVGIVGRNGAGKSTLLQLLCGTLTPTQGTLRVQGRVAPLLELGAGFNPDFSGIENVYMNAAILGLSREEVERRLESILAFADIGDFVHQPVKTYSSGMFVRLAFAVATAAEPDILVIDEALSVGDGAFARKSFERIMQLKAAGCTILFCSHSMYQVEALCSRAYWLEQGRVRLAGDAAHVTRVYGLSLTQEVAGRYSAPDVQTAAPAPQGSGRIVSASLQGHGQSGQSLAAHCGVTDVVVSVAFAIDPALPAPGVAVGISDANGLTVASAGTVNDGLVLACDAAGHGRVDLTLHRLPLLKGTYFVTVFLTTEDGIQPYDQVENCLRIDVTQTGLEQGLVSLPHAWSQP